MDAETLLFLGKNITHFLFSTLHLLLTRILPLIVMLVGSLVLHLLRLIISFLSPMLSWKALRMKANLSDSAVAHGWSPAAFNSAADHALEEEGLNLSGGDHEEVGASAVQEEELVFRDHEPSTATHVQEERFEDCFDGEFIEGQRLLLKQFEDMKSRVKTATNREMNEAGSVEQRMYYNPRGNGDILFPSDLPLTLDHVVQAAKDDAESWSRQGGGRAPSLTRRSIPPTLSNVQKALQEMRAQEIALSQAEPQPPRPANPATRTTSYDKFFAKFTQHFNLDRD